MGDMTTLDIAVFAMLAAVVLFALIMLIVSAVFAKKHRDADISAAPAAAVAPSDATLTDAAADMSAEEYIPPEYKYVEPSEYSDETKYVLSEAAPIAGNTRPPAERRGEWSNYEGEFKGYYFDPQENCYFEGKAPVYVQKMYLPEPPPPVVKKIMPPSAPLTSKPKAQRPELVKKSGFDMASIYGQYVVGRDGGEYYFTLYSAGGELLYASENYLTEEFCRQAVNRFKKHVLVGSFSVEEDGVDGYRYRLVRNVNVYLGPDKTTRVEAEDCIKNVKYFAQTDIVRAA